MTLTKSPDELAAELAAWSKPWRVAERLVARWLAEHGYATDINTKGPGSTDIEARGSTRSLLVQVKSAQQPEKPDTMAVEDVQKITARAARLGYDAYEARVTLDAQLRQVGEIEWRKLT